jgi:hypothetical protein
MLTTILSDQFQEFIKLSKTTVNVAHCVSTYPQLESWAKRFDVPNGCPAQWLRVVLTGQGVQGEVAIDDLAID